MSYSSASTFARGSRRAMLVGACVAACAGFAWAQNAATRGVLPFKSGAVATSAQAAPELITNVDAARVSGDRALIQFEAPLGRAQRAELEAVGVRLLSYVGDNAYFASFDAARSTGAVVADIRGVRAVLPISREWKLHPDIAAGVVHPWAVAAQDGADGARADDRMVAAYVVLHPDANLDAEAKAVAQRRHATVKSVIPIINGLVIELPASELALLADEPAVQWVEPPLPQLSAWNDSNRVRVGANIVNEPPYGLDGAGVKVLVYDAGTTFSHPGLAGRTTNRDNSGSIDHATHVAGTIGGSGAGSPDNKYRGMAPGVTMESYGFQQPGGLQQGFLYTDPGDIYADYSQAINTYGVHIANNSIGTNTAQNGFPCEWEGNYGFTDTVIDAIVRGDGTDPNFAAPFRVVWANGNERNSGACGSTYRTTAPPACAKNHITVGALNSNNDSVTGFTSWGPADDDRMKPDISAPGCQSDGDFGVTSSVGGNGYDAFCGTSMASPTVCGLGALLLQDFRQQFPGEPDFRNSTLKVILAHTARDIEEPGPDYKTGYGSVRVQPAVDLVRSGNFLEGVIEQDEVVEVIVIVGPDAAPVKVTLAWDDVIGTPNVNPVLVNDLDVRVLDSQGNTYYPWTLGGLANPSMPAVRTQPNRRDNIEQVLIDAPAPGAYRVQIIGFNIPAGPQPFSLAATPELVQCSSAGIAVLDAGAYACVSTATPRVVDCDLNTSEFVVDTVAVNVSSTSEPAGQTVTLVETDAASATFVGALNLGATSSPTTLRVSPGDTVTLRYEDVDTGSGVPATVIATASVDCTPPDVLGVSVTNITLDGASISFGTSENAKVTVRVGAACGQAAQTFTGAGFSTSHSFMLGGLADNNTYFISIEARDSVGNIAIDDNNGACYTFFTPIATSYFTELFPQGTNDLDYRAVEFTPAVLRPYVGCSYAVGSLPTDPTGGIPLEFTSDDQSIMIAAGGAVWVYGQPYSNVWVSANGYLTFSGADSASSETLDAHFSRVRVAVLFDNFSPQRPGASVSYKTLPDRLAVTYANVPEFNTSNSNTFQIEMFYDGRIRLSYLELAASDGLAGISRGVGKPIDYSSTDLSALAGCGERPPLTTHQIVHTAIGVDAVITLPGDDDGLPNPPGALSYIVTTLPLQPLRDAGDGQLITPGSLPFVLSGNQVRYEPAPGFSGGDALTFRVNDGGAAPFGGDSNVGTVALAVGGLQPIYRFTLDASPGWMTQGQWAHGDPLGGGGGSAGFPDPPTGFSGANVYGVNLLGNYGTNIGGPWHLTTSAFDCSDLTDVTLRFRRWLNTDAAPFVTATIEASKDGANWTPVWSNAGAPITENVWQQLSYSLASVADGEATVFVRWGYKVGLGAFPYAGWNLDDIEIWGVEPAAPSGCTGDMTCDGQINFGDIDRFVEALAYPGGAGWPYPCPWLNGDANGDLSVNFADIDAFVALIGSNCP